MTIQCFGEFRLCLDGRDQSGVINSGKIEELLAYLLLQDGKYVNKKKGGGSPLATAGNRAWYG